MSTPSAQEMDRFVWHRDDCDDDEGPCTCDYHLRLEQFRVDLAALVAEARAEAMHEAASIHFDLIDYDDDDLPYQVVEQYQAAIRALAAKGNA